MHASTPSAGRAVGAPRGPSTIQPGTNSNAIEKARLASLRRSTPDSEALMSSDDEHEMSKSIQSLTSKSVRQPTLSQEGSWLSGIHSGPPRRPSATTTTSGVSQPPTPLEPSGDTSAWPFQNPLGRVSSNPVTTPWSSAGPWGNAQSRIFSDDRIPTAVNQGRENVPYSISLQPTAKTHRSQSYSVGQMESDIANAASSGGHLERQRTTPSQQLPHRPSRPSMLSEVYEGAPGYMQERYERESFGSRGATSPLNPDVRRENVAESSHNPLLRHAIMPRARHGQSSSTSDTRSPIALHSSYQPPPHPSAYAAEQVIDEEPDDYTAAGLTRRFSELTGLGGPGEAARRGQWHTSLGFGNLPDIPQSRRHSMAEIPTRRNSLVAAAADQAVDFAPSDSTSPHLPISDPYQAALQDNYQRDMQNRNYAASYFSGVGPALRSRLESVQSPVSATSPGMPYQPSTPQGIFSRPGQDTLLYLVSFKCARAEVYYVADNTGLQVKEGDLVIVEADRGHDLGTVLNARIGWEQAKELKNKANDEHYRWLMMFSRFNQTSDGSSTGGTGGMMAGSVPERPPGPAGQGMNIFNPGMVEPGHRDSELKPKMIKRLAQPHEVATLRDKEGNEAKAKRICQQKVNEMKLDMEVLDAEFQTDWKKLTFFYYANSYVNFNALVTDLFKVYKTRIWMSAINPASLNTAAPLPPPRGLGPGAVSGREGPPGGRGAGARPYTGSSDFSEQYPPSGYSQPQMGNAYAYGNEQGPNHSGMSTPAQQAYEMMQYGASQAAAQAYNPSMQSYGWGAFGAPPTNNAPGAIGAPYTAAPLTFGSMLGPQRTRITPSGQASGFGLPNRSPQQPMPVRRQE